jgi:hypothetical protein
MGFAMWSRRVDRRWSRTVGSHFALPVLLAVLVPIAAARAAAAPVDMMPPSVFGEANVGQTLVGFPGVWSSGDSLELDYQWMRCPVTGPCTDIPSASSLVYRVAPDDAGHRILLRVSARSGDATTVRDSEPSERVPGASMPAQGASATSPPPVPAASGPAERRARMLEPFPEVRIRGRFTMRWTRFTLVSVRAPAGAAIAIECTGRGCPFRDRLRTATGRTPVRLAGLERRFRAGVALLLRVTKPGRIGKATRIWMRRGRRPGRWDRCVMPGSTEPVACPLA